MSAAKVVYIPVTPGGTYCDWLASDTEQQAIKKLLKDASHMPYNGWPGFRARDYRIEKTEWSE